MSPVLHFGTQSFHGPYFVGGISFPLLSKTLTVMFGYLALNRSITFEQLAQGARSASKLIGRRQGQVLLFALAHKAVVYLPSFAVGLRLSCPGIHSHNRHATIPPTMGHPSRSLPLVVPRLHKMTNAAKAHAEGNSVKKCYSIYS
jgi:hypothetical protein